MRVPHYEPDVCVRCYIGQQYIECLHCNWSLLTHWGRVTHICVGNLTIIGSDNGLSPGRRQAISWTNDGILLIGPLGTNFSEILMEILTFLFTKMRSKVSSATRRPFCLGLNMLIYPWRYTNCCSEHRMYLHLDPKIAHDNWIWVNMHTKYGWECYSIYEAHNTRLRLIFELGWLSYAE